MSERRHGAIGRRLLLAAVGAAVVRAAAAGAGAARAAADSGDVSLHRVHTGDLGMLIAVDVVVGGARSRWLVDTGATHHLVAPAFAARRDLPVRGTTRAATAFGRFEGRQVELPPLGVGAIVLAGEHCTRLKNSPATLSIAGVAGSASKFHAPPTGVTNGSSATISLPPQAASTAVAASTAARRCRRDDRRSCLVLRLLDDVGRSDPGQVLDARHDGERARAVDELRAQRVDLAPERGARSA